MFMIMMYINVRHVKQDAMSPEYGTTLDDDVRQYSRVGLACISEIEKWVGMRVVVIYIQ